MPNTTATQTVLQAPSLLISILSFLPIEDLLTSAQRVNSQWRSVISTSSVLQQAIFFKPRGRGTENEQGQITAMNPLLRKVFKPWFRVLGRRIKEQADYANDLSFSLCGLGESAMRADASWRKMLPVQPPATVLRIVKFNPTGLLAKAGTPPGEVCELAFEHGVRMGLLYDLAWETASKPLGSFAYLWHMIPLDEPKMERRFKECDEVTLIMDLSMPLAGSLNFMKPENKSSAYEEVELDFEVVDTRKLAHLAQMCVSSCKEEHHLDS